VYFNKCGKFGKYFSIGNGYVPIINVQVMSGQYKVLTVDPSTG